MKDMLTPAHVSTKEDETDRDLIRSREFLREQLNSFQRHLISLYRKSPIRNIRAKTSHFSLNKTSFY